MAHGNSPRRDLKVEPTDCPPCADFGTTAVALAGIRMAGLVMVKHRKPATIEGYHREVCGSGVTLLHKNTQPTTRRAKSGASQSI